MNRILIAMIVFLGFSAAQAATNTDKCFNNSTLVERSAMLTAFTKQDYQDFDKKFQTLCDKYPKNLTCSVETVSAADAEKKMTSLAGLGKCTETLRVDAGGETKIYFLNDKNVKATVKK